MFGLIINLFIFNTIFQKIISIFGVLLFSTFFVYDLQLIVGGKHNKFSYNIDDYILASISVYLDIVNMFLFILDLLNGNDINN